MVKFINNNYMPSKIFVTNLFNSSITQKLLIKVNEKIEEINRGLKQNGAYFLFAQKNFKLLVGFNKVFEIRSNIKGHRILFKFAKDLKNSSSLDAQVQLILDQCNDYDIFLLKYVDNHDEISLQASKINNKFSGISNIDSIETVKDEEIIIVDDSQIKKLYYCQNYSYLIPVLDSQQNSIVYDNAQFVLVQGIAGSGKTNMCIQKCLVEALKEDNKKVLYSTFSQGLLDYTKSFILENYILPLQKIINEFEFSTLNIESIKAMVMELNLDINSVDLTKETFIKYRNRLEKIDYILLARIANKDTIDFDYFDKFIKFDLSFALNNQIRKECLTSEIIYKEIEGVIFGFVRELIYLSNYEYNGLSFRDHILSFEEYQRIRQKEFSFKQINIIYKVALEYLKYLEMHIKDNGPTDKNIIAYNIYTKEQERKNQGSSFYDIAVLDEVQDFTQKELFAYKQLATKIFAVGDTRQMINPTYFSFDDFKRLLNVYNREYELTLNYRNTEVLNSAVQDLIGFGINIFGKWNDFANEIETTKTEESSNLYFARDGQLINELLATGVENYTILVPTNAEKKKFKVTNPMQVQTVSEFKGKESGLIILYNVLSVYKNQWERINDGLNSKIMNVNSPYRYYYNLFYVGVTRATRHLLIIEEDLPIIFEKEKFFNNFEYLNSAVSIETIKEKLDLKTYDDSERANKIDAYLKERKYEAAQYHISLIRNEKLKKSKQEQCNIYVTYVANKRFDEAIDKFLEVKLIDDAVEICNKLGKYNEVLMLRNLYKGDEGLGFGTLLDINFKTTSTVIKKITSEMLEKHRTETIQTSKIVQYLLKEIIEE